MSGAVGIPFGSYRLLRRIARGGMAEVFLARQTGLEGFDRLCAVKRILPHLVASREFVEMFLEEARLAAQLRHPNAVHIYDFGKVADHYFIAMEFVDGVAASQLITRAGDERLPFGLVARIGASACSGLDHAHNLHDVDGNALALVHRDVSPPNLLISYDGAIKLVDFGIAKAHSCVEDTRPGVVKGKYSYMSPEQTIGQMLDGRSDIFSLGIVLWELVTGQPAVRRDDPIAGMKMIRDGKIQAVEAVRPETPRELARAIGAALAPRREDRASALDLGHALERFTKASTGMSSNLELAQWVRKRFPRREIRASDIPAGTRQATQATHQLGISDLAGGAPGLLAGADLTEVSPPLFPSAGGTEIAVSLDAPPPVRRRLRQMLVATAALIGALVFTIVIATRQTTDPMPGSSAAAPDEQVASAAAAAPAVEKLLASLEVITDPADATIKIGELEVRGSPATATGLAPGTHVIEVARDGYRGESRALELGDGERRTIELSLEREPGPETRAPDAESVGKNAARDRGAPVIARPKKIGYLRARGIPYADVYVKGRKLGQTPLSSVELPTGRHRLRFVNPRSGATLVRVITIRPGETTRVTVKFD